MLFLIFRDKGYKTTTLLFLYFYYRHIFITWRNSKNWVKLELKPESIQLDPTKYQNIILQKAKFESLERESGEWNERNR